VERETTDEQISSFMVFFTDKFPVGFRRKFGLLFKKTAKIAGVVKIELKRNLLAVIIRM
jgi:hypothetical protein